jgi:hypothetical protein
MVDTVLRMLTHQSAHAKRLLIGGLTVALVVTALLIAGILTGTLPPIVFGSLVALGMAALVISDLRRRDGTPSPKSDPEPDVVPTPPAHTRQAVVAGAGAAPKDHGRRRHR